MPKMFRFLKSSATPQRGATFEVVQKSIPRSGWFTVHKRDVDEQVEAVLNGSTIAPTSVFSTRADEILDRLRERTI